MASFVKGQKQPSAMLCDEKVIVILIIVSLADYIMSPHWNECPTYEEAYKKSLEYPEEFWSEIGGCIDWSKPWHKVLDNSNEPFTKWYLEKNH